MAFANDGYEVLPVFRPAEILALHDDVTEHIDRVANALHLPFEASAPDAPFAERLERIAKHDPSHANLLRIALCTDAHRGRRFSGLLNHAALKAAAEELAGVPLGEPIMRLRANVPTLTRARSGWHSDVALLEGTCNTVRIAAWIPLMDAGPGNGGLEVAVGRRDAPLPHEKGSNEFHIPDAALEGLPKAPLDCPLGGCVFLDRFTPHRALPNTSEEARLSVVIWMKAATLH